MTASYAGGNDALCDAGGDSTFDNGGDGIHRTNDLGLELRGNVQFDLLEEVFRGTKAANDQNILWFSKVSITLVQRRLRRVGLLGGFCFGLGWQ